MENQTAFYLHPIAVHFPIAFCALELLFLILWRLKNDGAYLRFAGFVFRLAFLLMIPAALTGLRDAGGFQQITGGVRTHALASAAAVLFAAIRLFLWQMLKTRSHAGLLISTSILLNLMVSAAGFWGGKLVYE